MTKKGVLSPARSPNQELSQPLSSLKLREEVFGLDGSLLFYFYLFILINLFIYFWLCWVFVAACGLSLVAASGGYSVAVRGLLIAVASLVAEHRL